MKKFNSLVDFYPIKRVIALEIIILTVFDMKSTFLSLRVIIFCVKSTFRCFLSEINILVVTL